MQGKEVRRDVLLTLGHVGDTHIFVRKNVGKGLGIIGGDQINIRALQTEQRPTGSAGQPLQGAAFTDGFAVPLQTNGNSNGLVPMLRVYNNTARYVDQGGNKVP